MEPLSSFTEPLPSGTHSNLFITEPMLCYGEIMEFRGQWLDKI